MRVPVCHQLAQGGEVSGDFVLSDFHARDADALGVTDEVRRSKETGARAGGPGYRVDERAGGSFAIGSRNVNDLGPVRREGEVLAQHPLRILQAQLDAEELGGVEPVDGLGIGHTDERTSLMELVNSGQGRGEGRSGALPCCKTRETFLTPASCNRGVVRCALSGISVSRWHRPSRGRA
jgi:hypothetical protein